ncbi:hypothetical protein SAMN05444000_104232 [Shimia gijangensis]|uniref:Uncharacterized protein n=1 Tax=Shimia gijangensis TaxID=1470563 RepID=A0A1M6G254_9RHOB|nr:hypothetical protein [Shimia gijangensis]SHJ03942.1 hypothetical protein SAMN05444000_104232 [Shimia gijangensis]
MTSNQFQFSLSLLASVAVLGVALNSKVVLAAELEMTEVPEMYCFGTLRGVLERGDADRIKPVLEDRRVANGKRLCLDSPGGSLVEGVRLAELLIETRRGTAIDKGAQCESACALAFMGGASKRRE